MAVAGLRVTWAALCCLLLCAGPISAKPSACVSLAALVDAPGPLFLASFPASPPRELLHVAFLYDNAAAALALIGCGEKNKAAQIGDAILVALEHDRFWHDGRLRNGYLAAPVTQFPVKLAGWWDAKQNIWVEDRYQVGADTGNMAWAMLALLALNRAGEGEKYLSGAARIGTFVEKSFDARAPAGFSGGTFGHEPAPVQNGWMSTEHNTDLSAAFRGLAEATGNPHWRGRAQQAQDFVAAMWSASCNCFAAGTAVDGQPRNTFLALDAQLWPLLAIPGGSQRYAKALLTARRYLRVGDGFAYSEAREGIWTEGTAQAALLMALMGRRQLAQASMAALERNRAPDGSYYATGGRQAPTGFMLQTDPTLPRLYFHIPHLAALAWAALAQQRFNPFTGTRALPK